MFSQHISDAIDTFFYRLNAQLKRMPQEDRAEVHQELRQHLEALVTAHMELGATRDEAIRAALWQFGHPAKIGRKMISEWRKTHRPEINPLLLSVLCSTGIFAVGWFYCLSQLMWYSPSFEALLCWWLPLLSGIFTGFCFPRQAVGATLISMTCLLTFLLCAAPVFAWDYAKISGWTSSDQTRIWMIREIIQLGERWLPLGATSAWLTSRLRRPKISAITT